MPEAALLHPDPAELIPVGAVDRPDVALRAVPEPAPPIPRLEIPDYDLSAALALRRQLGVSHVLAQILVANLHVHLFGLLQHADGLG